MSADFHHLKRFEKVSMKTVALFVLIAGCIVYNTEAVQIHDPVILPASASLRVENELYTHRSPPNLMGDGLRCLVVKVGADDLNEFIEKQVAESREWATGSLQKYQLHLEVLDWFEQWAQTKGIFDELNRAINLDALKNRNDIHHRVIINRNQDEVIRNATMWIIVPDQNIVCIFEGDT